MRVQWKAMFIFSDFSFVPSGTAAPIFARFYFVFYSFASSLQCSSFFLPSPPLHSVALPVCHPQTTENIQLMLPLLLDSAQAGYAVSSTPAKAKRGALNSSSYTSYTITLIPHGVRNVKHTGLICYTALPAYLVGKIQPWWSELRAWISRVVEGIQRVKGGIS